MPGGNLPTLPVKRVVRPTPSIPDHEVVRQIGSGAYGEVWLGKIPDRGVARRQNRMEGGF